MKPLPIQLEPDFGSESPAIAGGWIRSEDPVHWLQEAAQMRSPGASNPPEIHPVTLDGQTHGAVILCRDSGTPSLSARALPLVHLLPNVLGLKGSQINVSLLEHEIKLSAFPNQLSLFLPGLGLITLDEESFLKPRDFFVIEQSTTTWNHAHDNPHTDPKLTGIRVDLPEKGEDISIAGDEVGDLRGKKIDSSKGFDKLKNGIGLGLGGLAAGPILGLGKLINMLPDGPGSTSPSAFDKLEAWASRNWQNLLNARKRELDKLMDLMDKDPDLGLRYALPLGGAEAGRGKAPKSWTLGQRNLRLGSNQGGGAADEWDLDYETRLKLEQQYRKAAGEAEARKDYQKAAYIYGELLNDWPAAAAALIKAGRHRDAVGIYLHKLHDKPRAAAALEEAGLLLQAAELYLEIQKFEKAGDLFQKRGHQEKAEELWQQAVDHTNDPLEKARLLDTKLARPDEAIRILDESWRSNRQAVACLRAQFKLYRKGSENDDKIRDLIKEFESAPNSILSDLQKARLCVDLEQNVLGHEYQRPLEETILHLSSRTLLSNPASKTGHTILAELKNLRKDDQLLSRDVNRFTVRNKDIKIPPSRRKAGHLSPVATISIPQTGDWKSLASLGENTSIAGVTADSLVVAQLQGRSCLGSELKTDEFARGTFKVHHVGLSNGSQKARVFHFRPGNRIHFRSINSKRTAAHDHLGSIHNVLAIGPVNDDRFMTLVYHDTSSLVMNHYNLSGTKEVSTVLDLAPPEMAEPHWYCASRQEHTCLSANLFAAWRFPDGSMAACQLNEPIHKLSMSPRYHQIRALISSESEAAVLTPRKNGQTPEFINLYMSDGTHPCHATFARNGDVIAISGHRGEIFADGKFATPVATFSFPEELGFAIDLCPRKGSSFVVLTSNGKLVLFD